MNLGRKARARKRRPKARTRLMLNKSFIWGDHIAVKSRRRTDELEVDGFEFSAVAEGGARDHEDAVAAVVDGFGVAGGGRDVGFDDFEDEEAVFVDQAGVDEFAFEVGEAFGDEGGFYFSGGERGEGELFEL